MTRVPDPADRRAKLVRPTDRGNEVVRIAQELVPEVEQWVATVLDPERTEALRRDLETLSQALRQLGDAAQSSPFRARTSRRA